jgi:type IV secretory pathway TrbD component
MAIRTVPIRRSSNRDNLFMGGDREMVMLMGLICGALIFSAQETKAFIVGVTLWVLSLFLFRAMAKADPKMRHVYMRQRRYATYYSARSTPYRINGPKEDRQYR